MAARRLAARGELEICQRGVVVDATRARGPIRLRRARERSPSELTASARSTDATASMLTKVHRPGSGEERTP
jgi:hypothetical protein